MSERFYGSICVTDLVDLAHKKHSAFSKADNGKIYANVTVWLNDTKDKYGNIMAVQLSPKKELRDLDGQPYIGNMKEAEAKVVSSRDTSGLALPDDIPTGERKNSENAGTSNAASPTDGLPF
jgi:hypothetical protein